MLFQFLFLFFSYIPTLLNQFLQFTIRIFIRITSQDNMDFADAFRQLFPKTTTVFQLIGALIIIKKLFSIFSKILKLLRKRKNLKKRYGENSWVFITGSSDGIGKALALSFAKQGFNIIISARTESKLQQVKAQIKQKYPNCDVKILVADYKKAIDWKYISKLLEQIAGLDISIVVNNVGVDVFSKYVQLQPQVIQDLISINCYSVAFFNRHFLPIFKERTKNTKKKCAMVNVASIAGTLPMSYYNVYSASKAYVDRLSLSLNYQHPQIDIISIRPSQVSTQMTMNKETDIFTIKADQCAEGILNQIGYDRYSYGHWRHMLQGWIYQAIPQKLFMLIFQKIFVPDQEKRRKQGK